MKLPKVCLPIFVLASCNSGFRFQRTDAELKMFLGEDIKVTPKMQKIREFFKEIGSVGTKSYYQDGCLAIVAKY